jgi:glutamate:GABA antiporter
VGVLLFNYVGFELPSSAGQEMTDPQRDVPFAIARSAVGSFVLYALPVIGILVVLPSAAITNFSGFISAIQTVFTVYGGQVTAAGPATLSGAGLVLGDASAILFILCLQITSGDAAKYFNAVLGVTISTTLISYLLIYPALWKLRRSHPDTPRPFRMPAHRALTVLLMVLVAVAAVQLIAPGGPGPRPPR